MNHRDTIDTRNQINNDRTITKKTIIYLFKNNEYSTSHICHQQLKRVTENTTQHYQHQLLIN